MTSSTQVIVAALLSYLPFPVLLLGFRRRLASRRDQYVRLLGYQRRPVSQESRWSVARFLPESGELATPDTDLGRAFSAAYTGQDPFVEFERLYSVRNYTAPLILLALVVPLTTLAVCAMAHLGDPLRLQPFTEALGRVSIIAATASVIWALQDLVDRYSSGDLTSGAMHAMWMRPVLAALVAPVLAALAAETAQYAAAIALGLFPVQTIKRALQTKSPLGRTSIAEDPPSLFLLQGMTEGIQERLREEGIERVQHLAYRNPYQLLLRCDIDWSTIIDFVDQALLVQHVGERIKDLRVIGVRGAIDMAALYERLRAKKAEDLSEVLARLGKALGEDQHVVVNLSYTLWTDPVVQFLWQQWAVSSPSGTRKKGS